MEEEPPANTEITQRIASFFGDSTSSLPASVNDKSKPRRASFFSDSTSSLPASVNDKSKPKRASFFGDSTRSLPASVNDKSKPRRASFFGDSTSSLPASVNDMSTSKLDSSTTSIFSDDINKLPKASFAVDRTNRRPTVSFADDFTSGPRRVSFTAGTHQHETLTYDELVARGIMGPDASPAKDDEAPKNFSIFDVEEDVAPTGQVGEEESAAPRVLEVKRDIIPFDEAVTQGLIGPEQSPGAALRFLSHDKKLIDVESMEEDDLPQTFLDRLQYFSWGWYSCTMTTGGLVTMLSPGMQPHKFAGLEIIGDIVFIWDLCLFTLFTAAIIYRFIRFPGSFTRSVNHVGELVLIAPPLLSFNTITTGIAIYGIPHAGNWLRVAWRVLFWLYMAVATLLGVALYSKLFSLKALHLDEISPAVMMPVFPMMLSGPLGATGAATQPLDYAWEMMLCALSCHGLGIIISLLVMGLFFHRLLEFGLPPPAVRPAMAVCGGPTSFTTSVLFSVSNDYSHTFTGLFGDDEITLHTVQIFARVAMLFVYPLGLFFETLAVISILKDVTDMSFRMNWWSMVFPNMGLTMATISLGKAFGSQGLMWIGSIMTCITVAAYIFVFCAMIRAVYRRDILWPGKDEDKYIAKRRRKVIHFEYE